MLTSLLYRHHDPRGLAAQLHLEPGADVRLELPALPSAHGHPEPARSNHHRQLLRYLPNTDAIAQAVNFYFTFAFSTPYQPFIPFGGVGEQLFFPGGRSDQRNRALVDLRRGLAGFIRDYQPEMPQRFQWPLNIET